MQIRRRYFVAIIAATLIVGMCLGVSAVTLALAGVIGAAQRNESAWVQATPHATEHNNMEHGNATGGSAGNGPSVNVAARDFAFSLDTAEIKAGTVTFVVKNNGSMPHDFEIRGDGVTQKTEMLDPGETASLTVDLQPGTYTYVCTVGGHNFLGMKGTFTVSPT